MRGKQASNGDFARIGQHPTFEVLGCVFGSRLADFVGIHVITSSGGELPSSVPPRAAKIENRGRSAHASFAHDSEVGGVIPLGACKSLLFELAELICRWHVGGEALHISLLIKAVTLLLGHLWNRSEEHTSELQSLRHL